MGSQSKAIVVGTFSTQLTYAKHSWMIKIRGEQEHASSATEFGPNNIEVRLSRQESQSCEERSSSLGALVVFIARLRRSGIDTQQMHLRRSLASGKTDLRDLES